jgi:hypothetical protein
MYLTIALVASFLLVFAPALGALVVGLATVAGRTPRPASRRD